MGLFDFLKPRKGIDEQRFNKAQYQKEILALAHMLYFQNKHSYEIVKEHLAKEGLSDAQCDTVISRLKLVVDKMVSDFENDLDSGTITDLKIIPSEAHKPGETDKEQVDKYIGWGAFQINRGDYENAMQLLDKALELDPTAALAYANKAVIYSQQGKIEMSLAAYDKAISLDPGNVKIYMNKAAVLEEAGREDELISCYEKVVSIAPGNVEIWNDLGVMYAQQQKYNDALRCFEKLLHIDNNDEDAQTNKLNVLMHMGRQEDAYHYYRQLIKRNSINDRIHLIIPQYLLSTGAREAAVDFFDKFYHETGNSEYLRLKAILLYSIDKNAALQSISRYLETHPASEEGLSLKMDLVSEQPDVTEEDFIKAVDDCLASNDKNLNALSYKIQYFTRYGHIDEAITLAEKMYGYFPDEQHPIQLLINLIGKHKTKQEAFEVFERLKRNNPDQVYNINFRKGLYLKFMNEYDEAIALFNSQNQTYEFAWNYYQMGIIENLRGNKQECLRLLKRTFELDPGLKADALAYVELQNLKNDPDFILLTR